MASLNLNQLTRHFGGPHPAVDRVSLQVANGEFLALLGPSGCGKTTLLRMIAGFENPDSGQIVIAGETVAESGYAVPPEHRHIGMVFQSYALWPHMTVEENVAFALEVRRTAAAEIRKRVNEALAKVGLTDLAKRRPAALSGGQRQRVALARCLAARPRLVLLDEPLANLDAHLREEMQIEFRRLHKESGTTFVYVTHDQTEAMALADRIAVMAEGRLEQVAEPETLWRESATPMVARFIGAGNLVPVTVTGHLDNGHSSALLFGNPVILRGGQGLTGEQTCVLRPNDLALSQEQHDGLRCRLLDAVYRGGRWRLSLQPLQNSAGIRLELDSDHRPDSSEISLALIGGWILPAQANA